MLDWIEGYVKRWAAFVLAPIIDLVHWGLHAVAGVVYTVFQHVHAAWLVVHGAATHIADWLEHFGAELVAYIKQIVTVDIPVLWNIMLQNVKGLLADIAKIWGEAQALIQKALDSALLAVASLSKWVIDNVWNPLVASVKQLEADLLKWGYAAWQLLNDPAKLASILLGALVAAAEDAFWSLAGPVGRFALGIVLRNAGKFAQLIEAIVSAVV